MTRAANLAGLLAGLLLSGCSPWVVWHGHTPDRSERVVLLEQNGRQELLVEGNVFASFEAIGFEGLAFSEDGLHLALPAQIEGRWHVVHDGEVGPPFDGIGELVMDPSGRHLAYAALDGASWRVVHDGRMGPPAHDIRAGSLRLAAGGARHAYIVRRGPALHAVIDGELGPPFEEIAQLGFGDRGRRVAYVGRRGGQARLVIDGRAEAPALAITELVLAERAPAYAYLADKGEGMTLIADGAVYGDSHEELGGLRLSADGAHLAVLARDEEGERVLWDGRWQATFARVEDSSLTLGEDGRHLGYVARDRGGARAVLDGVPGPAYLEVDPPLHRAGRWAYVGRGAGASVVHLGASAFVHRGAWAGALVAPEGRRRYAYLLRRGRRTVVVCDRGVSDPIDAIVEGTLVFDPAARRWAALAADREARRLFVLLEGGGRRPFDLDELSARLMQGGELRRAEGIAHALRRWLRAEISASLEEAHDAESPQ